MSVMESEGVRTYNWRGLADNMRAPPYDSTNTALPSLASSGEGRDDSISAKIHNHQHQHFNQRLKLFGTAQ
jgi:hypothetical protein